MDRRKIIYGMMMVGAVTLMGCSADDVTKEATSGDAVAISFSCNKDDDVTRAPYQGIMNIEDLYYTGFGVFASTAESKPDLMYNQEVEFTFVGDMDDPLKGYWSYQPVKYWPANMSSFFISAYAPYQQLPIPEPGIGEPEREGIIGISTNSAEPYVTYRRCEKPESCVDLLWYFEAPTSIPAPSGKQRGLVDLTMRHALARLEINVALASAPASGTKVLVESITLTGRMAKTGQLSLSSQTTVTEGEGVEAVTKYYPDWSAQTYDQNGSGDDIDHTITIDNEDNSATSYGIIDAAIRYVEGLPYAWQPAGLRADDPGTDDVNEGLQNALSTGDRKTYVYLIPQGALQLQIKVKCHKKTADDDQVIIKTTTATLTTVANPLKGNTTYTLNLTLSGI